MDHQEEELEPAETDFDIAVDLYMQYMIQYMAWKDPREGAVSPAASAFFAASPPGESGFVGFSRWLMRPYETDHGLYLLRSERALAYVEALHPRDNDELAAMRQAIVDAAALREGHLEED